MENYINMLVSNADLFASIHSKKPNFATDWYNSFGLSLCLFNNESKDCKKALKIKEKTRKKIIAREPHVKTLEEAREAFAATKRFESYENTVDAYKFPCADAKWRVHHLSEVLELLAADRTEEALAAIERLPVDFQLHQSLWGQIILFILTAQSGDQAEAKQLAQGLFELSQGEFYHIMLGVVMPALCKRFLAEEFYPWQMKMVEVNWEGQTYYCVPVTIHNSQTDGGNEFMQIPWFEREKVENVYYRDERGRRYHTVETVATNTVTTAVSVAANLAVNITAQSISAAARYYSKGKFQAYSGINPLNTMMLSKSVHLPIDSRGYIVSTDKAVIAPWLAYGESAKVNNHDAFLNLVDGQVYKGPKGKDIPNAEGLLALLAKQINE
ncbi:hypothetical protein ACFFLZ_07725 [Photobacterium aphoticum]|uniref:Uncharacterized protein n=1 Tax=Photobacterium aphoticum TaxID=754436 RepID=A0A0J1GPA2_9GAMM|nr:hypothetical protein [Photobacterium aphoticum]KLV01234.1 hypothetical protein ABT58_08930 [Photobacterium aphoticum]PSU57032.1 hypothetical protein C9I90_11060 [Photobacterium aphoticum]GHA50014.1 hypothetical protein GCM10007086_24900 [Photobacterium aphoticum]